MAAPAGLTIQRQLAEPLRQQQLAALAHGQPGMPHRGIGLARAVGVAEKQRIARLACEFQPPPLDAWRCMQSQNLALNPANI